MIFAFIVQLVVCLLIMRWILKQKTGEKYSKKVVVKFFIFGVIAVVFALTVSMLISLERDAFFNLNPYLGGFLTALLTAALLEEVSKYIFFRLAIFKNQEVKSWLDVIIASVVVGIGFTLMEDVTYSMFGDGNILRAFFPMHILFQLIMGYFYGRACVNKSIKDHILAIVLPTLSHAVFDMFLIDMAIVIESQDVEAVKKLTTEELMTMPYFKDIIIMFCGAVVTTIASLVILIVFLKKVGGWSRNGEKQEPLSFDTNTK